MYGNCGQGVPKNMRIWVSEIAQSRNLFGRGGLPGEGAIPTYRTVAMNVSRVTHRLRRVIALQAIKACSVWRSVVGHCYTRFPVIVAFDALPSFVRCFTSLDAPFISLSVMSIYYFAATIAVRPSVPRAH